MLAAGLLMCKVSVHRFQYFLVHPGGPYFKNKDAGYWSIPKGIPEKDEVLLDTAQREFYEETGIRPLGPFHDLGTIRQKGGKEVHAWAFAGEWEAESGIACNTFTIEWPPRSGKRATFPEIDKAAWFDYDSAVNMIIPKQRPFIDRGREILEKTNGNHLSSD